MKILKRKPQFAALLLGGKEIWKEVKTTKWETSEHVLTFYIYLEKNVFKKALAKSGTHAVFAQRLAQDITTKPSILWVAREKDEASIDYFIRTSAQAKGSPMAW